MIAAGGGHTCLLLSSGQVKCWGRNYFGQLGNANTTDQSLPGNVMGLPADIISVDSGGDHSCALARDGSAWCWGRNTFGELGNNTGADSSTPQQVTGPNAVFSQIDTGKDHTCGRTVQGAAMCWGSNTNGQIGDGSYNTAYAATIVSGLSSGVVAVSAGDYHSCALKIDGSVVCWGANYSGQLGDGSGSPSVTPVSVTGLGGTAIAISAGGSHTCALLSDGIVKCWGAGAFGQLGTGGWGYVTTPVTVANLSVQMRDVTAGGSHTCSLDVLGFVKCWGQNIFGQVGDGTLSNQSLPVAAQLSNRAFDVSAGAQHTCALILPGKVVCWGQNTFGQLGDGTTNSTSAPEVVFVYQLYNTFVPNTARLAPAGW